MIQRPLRLALAGLLALASGVASGGTLTLKSVGGATLGGVTTVEVSGTPGEKFLVVLSLTAGPTSLPLPNQPSTIDVGFDLIDLSLQIPGFLGTIPAGGTAVIALPIPGDPILTAVTLHLQALRIIFNAHFDGKSNPWTWTPAFPGTTRPAIGTMPVARAGHTATTLTDGRVLFIGGGADGVVASYGQKSIDRYDPGTQTWTQLNQMSSARVSHTATTLLNGKILIAGGADDVQGEPIATAELYDPATNVLTPVGNLASPRALHNASLLPDGRVLLTGGTTSFANPSDIVTHSLKTTEIFNPATNTFSAGPNMAEPRVGHTMTTLNNGKILIAGGFSWVTILFTIPYVTDKAQLYTPNAGAGTFGSQITMTGDRFAHAAIKLDDGNVAIIGGAQDQLASPFNPVAVNTIELFDAATSTFSPFAAMSVPRGVAAVSRLPDGRIVIAGGAFGSLSTPTPDGTVDVMEQSGFVSATLNMQHVRANFTATTLVDGTVLLAGGGEYPDPGNPNLLDSWDDAEILHP